MSESSQFDFTKFVPGFDFLKQLSQTNTALPQAHQWIAPTVDPQEIEKRIQELKTVHFWLEQNTRAVLATVQALEVQLMTINTLKGMNMSMSEMAKGLQIKPQAPGRNSDEPVEGGKAQKRDYFSQPSREQDSQSESAYEEQEQEQAKAQAQAQSQSQAAQDSVSKGQATQAVDPMAWWGALSQQFSQIANQTFAEIQKNSAAVAAASAKSKSNSSVKETATSSATATKKASANVGKNAGAKAQTHQSKSARINKASSKKSKSVSTSGNATAKVAPKSPASKTAKKEPAREARDKKSAATKRLTTKVVQAVSAQKKSNSVRSPNAQAKTTNDPSDLLSTAKSWFSSPPPLTRKTVGGKKRA